MSNTMHFYRRYQFRLTKADTTGILLRRAIEVAGPAATAKFFLADSTSGHASIVDRVAKSYAPLASFNCMIEEKTDSKVRALSNLDGRFDHPNPNGVTGTVPLSTLAEIADGIPRRFPFGYATFLIEGFPEQCPSSPPAGGHPWPDIDPALLGNSVPGILLTSRWWTPRRELKFSACVPVALAEGGGRVSNPPPDVIARLAQLGRIPKKAPLVGLAPPEGSTPDLSRIAAVSSSWKENLQQRVSTLPLPHALPVDPPRSVGSGFTSPHKASLVITFRPRGYRPDSEGSGHGFFQFRKTTSRGNNLTLSVDVGGAISHSCSAFLGLEGPGWYSPFHLAVSPGPWGGQYPISSPEIWRQVVENLAVVVDHAEATSVADAEALAPFAPAWFSAEN